MLPNSLNPRYSYGGSKIISELIAFNYGQDHFRKVQVFRPHNVYGPDMGWKHVIPQFIMRAAEVLAGGRKAAPFPIQGDGHETRAFAYVDDVVDGIITMYENGGHREIYHIGNDHEVSILDLVERLGTIMGGKLQVQPTEGPEGGTPRRCPDISKIRALGYSPKVDLTEGLRRTAEWYLAHRDRVATNELM
jgi:UDP-glucose 4-epimerase